jgi:hypothetical protein
MLFDIQSRDRLLFGHRLYSNVVQEQEQRYYGDFVSPDLHPKFHQ